MKHVSQYTGMSFRSQAIIPTMRIRSPLVFLTELRIISWEVQINNLILGDINASHKSQRIAPRIMLDYVL